MNSKERLTMVSSGKRADRVPFLPTIFEHCARLLGKTPSEVAVDENLIEEAQVKAYELYRNDAVTVGVDVYNIEVEALGCNLRFYDDASIPGVTNHPFEESFDPDKITFSVNKGRISKILNASVNINKRIGSEVGVGIGISGPFSICAELAGFENIVVDCITNGSKVHEMLKAVLEFQKRYCDEIICRSLGITIFESWATPPLISPDIYREFVAPYERKLIYYIKSKGTAAVPLIIGGDTTLIVDDIIDTGTTLIIADYKVDIETYVDKAAKKGLLLRGNIDPKLAQKGSAIEIIAQVKNLLEKTGHYKKFILGTGVIPYDTPSENILAIRDYLEKGG